MNYEKEALVFKALSDKNRLRILEILSCNCSEKCACHILENFDITQPTLSHHMKVLMDADLVIMRKEGSFSYYYLNKASISKLSEFLNYLINNNDDCRCGCKNKKGKE